MQIRTLDFDRDFLTRVKTCPIDLSERRRSNRLCVYFRIRLVHSLPQFCFNDCKRISARKCRDLVLQSRKLFHIFEWQKIGTRSERLTDLYERWTKINQRFAQPHGLLLESRLFFCRTISAAKHEIT